VRMSSKIAERLLQGWTMLAESCPIESCYAPLMKNKKTDETWCVVCDKRVMFLVDATDSRTEQDESVEQTIETEYPEVEISKEELERIRKRCEIRDKVSENIGEKMLSGWRMLGEHCIQPDCLEIGVPLLQDRSGQKHCLLCAEMQEKPQRTTSNTQSNPKFPAKALEDREQELQEKVKESQEPLSSQAGSISDNFAKTILNLSSFMSQLPAKEHEEISRVCSVISLVSETFEKTRKIL